MTETNEQIVDATFDDEPKTAAPVDIGEEVRDASSVAVSPIVERVVKERGLQAQVDDLSSIVLAGKVTDRASYEKVAGDLVKTKSMLKLLDSTFEPIFAAQRAAIEVTREQYNKLAQPLLDGETHGKAQLSSYDAEQKRLAQERQKAADAIVEQEARNRRIEAASDAEVDGRTDDADAIMAAPLHVAPAVVPVETPKVKGISYTTTWKGQLDDLAALVLAAADELRDPDKTKPRQHFAILNHDTVKKTISSSVNSTAKNLKSEFKIKGCRAWSEQTTNVRG